MTPGPPPSTSAQAGEVLEGGDAVGRRPAGESKLADLLHRRRQPGLVVVGLPARREAPEHVGRADDVAGPASRSATERMYGPTPKISWISEHGRARPAAGIQTCIVDRAVVADDHLFVRCVVTAARCVAHAAVRSLAARAPGRLRLRAARGPHRPGRRSNRATRPGCSSTGGSAPPEHRARRRPARPAAARRPRGRQRDAGDPGPAARCAAPPGARPRCCCWSRSAPTADVGGAGPPGPPPARRRGAARPPTAPPCSTIGARTAAGDTFHVELLGADDPLGAARPARRDAAAAVHPHAARPIPSATRPCTPREPGSAAAPTAGLHLTPELLGRSWPPPGVERRAGRAGRRPRHVPAHHRADDPLRPPHAQRALPRARGDVATPCRRPSGWSPSAPPACGRSRARRRPARWRAGPSCSSTAASTCQVVDVLLTNFHLPRTTLLLMIDAFVGPRWRTLYATALADGLPVPVLRRRHAARPARRVASLACIRSASTSRRPTAPRGPAWPRRPGAPTARRASCRSAPAAPSSTSSAADYERARRRDRARQHVPPDAAARGRGGGPLRRARRRSPAGTG